jgi:hypothetical protein
VIAVGRLAPGDQWDQNLIDRLLSNELYPTGTDFDRSEGYPRAAGAVMVIPGRYWAGHESEISDALNAYRWVLGIRTGDEEDLFNVAAVTHPNLRWWIQTPCPGREYPDGARFIPIGFPPHFNSMPALPPLKDFDVFLSAQNTHQRRHLAFEALKQIPGAFTRETEGFTQGFSPGAYRQAMEHAKVAPAPSGAVCQDSFRVWEALEAHAVPVVDAVSPTRGDDGFWKQLFGLYPFDVYWDGAGLANDVAAIVSHTHPGYANRVTAWWMRYKRQLAHWLREDLEKLGAL